MRNFFSLILLQIAIIFSVQSEELVRAFSFYDLTSSRMNSSHTDGQGYTIKVSTNEPSESMFFYRTVSNPLSCISETPSNPATGAEYATVVLKGEDNVSEANSPYILVELDPDSEMREIRLIGRGGSTNPSNGGELLYGYSNTTSNDADFYLTHDGSSFFEGWLFFYNTECNAYGELTSIKVPEGARYVKIIMTKSFLGNNVSSFSTSTMLYAMDFYKEASAVGVGTDKKETYELTQNGTLINTCELSDFMVYNLSGMCVLNEMNTQELDLSHLSNGLYIVKAISNESGESGTLKVLLKN